MEMLGSLRHTLGDCKNHVAGVPTPKGDPTARKPAAAGRRQAVALPPEQCSMRLACLALFRPGLLLPK